MRQWLAGLWWIAKFGARCAGTLDIDSHRVVEHLVQTVVPGARVRVFVDGVDRTDRLRAADDRAGWVFGYVDAFDRPLTIETCGRRVLRGEVEYRLA